MEVQAHQERQKVHPPSAFLLYLGPWWFGCCLPTLMRVELLSSVYWIERSSLSETRSWTHPEIMLCQHSRLPLAKLMYKMNCHMVAYSLNIYWEPFGSWLWEDEDVNTGILSLEFLRSSCSRKAGIGETNEGWSCQHWEVGSQWLVPWAMEAQTQKINLTGCVCVCVWVGVPPCTHMCHTCMIMDFAVTVAWVSGSAGWQAVLEAANVNM